MKILFFGSLGDRIGREVEVTVPAEGCAVSELRQMISAGNPNAASALASSSVRACVDDVIVPDTFVLRPGSEVAFFPPLSGG